MNKTDIIKYCKDLGCCDACCLRYLGLKNPTAYENPREYILKLQTSNKPSETVESKSTSSPSLENSKEDASVPTESNTNGTGKESNGAPPAKRCKTGDVCVSCIGVLQQDSWPQCLDMVKEVFDKKKYECDSFASALSAPISTILREKVITLHLADRVAHYDTKCVTPLKEAWKWSLGAALAARLGMTSASGAVAPLLITINIDYPDDLQELEILKTLSPSLFESRSKQKRRFTVEFTRRSVEQALDDVTLASLRSLGGAQWSEALPAVTTHARCVSVMCTHEPMYLGGRYVKMSRELPQTPWLVNGVRMMPSSVQEIIFQPIADKYKLSPEEAERRFKFMSAGREDVDVRCRGAGRPFAIEILDPPRALSPAELRQVCEDISRAGTVLVAQLVYVTKEDLAELKRGEESKCKTYEALCIKLTHTEHDLNTVGVDSPVTVTERDIARINEYTNTQGSEGGEQGGGARVILVQRTPLRVLHRRPLRARVRHLLHVEASQVAGQPRLLALRVRTDAGTYVKEWAHGDAGRTVPSLGDALGARADMLALDVTQVHLAWPPVKSASTTNNTTEGATVT